MIKQNDILNEKNIKILKETSEEVVFPLSKEYKDKIYDMINYLRLSQDEEYAKKHNLRAGMGLAAVQLGIHKRFFVISYKKENGTFEEYVVINPKIISHSAEEIYVEEGEGCLSVTRYVEGIIPRFARINVEFYDENGKLHNIRVREEISVAFQHEIDHLNGILFTDRIDKNNPFKNKDKLRAI